MAKWEYDLSTCGKDLRESIDNGDESMESCIATMEKLAACYERIKELVPEDDFEFYFYDAFDMVNGMIHDMKTYPDDDEGIAESVNECLAEFYDLCDEHRIWVSL